MEFSFDVNLLLPETVTKTVGGRYENYPSEREKLFEVVNKMGAASAHAQGLRGPITSFQKLQFSPETLYLLKGSTERSGRGVVLGMIKVGKKRLFLNDGHGTQHEVEPLCVLDFYVHESRQRTGCGKKLYEAMMEGEGVKPYEVAIDKPSSKFLSFLRKHYKLHSFFHQANNFVVFEQFFQTCKVQCVFGGIVVGNLLLLLKINEVRRISSVLLPGVSIQHSSRKPWHNFKSHHHPPPSETTCHSHPKITDKPLDSIPAHSTDSNPKVADKPLSTNSNQAASTATSLVNPLPTKDPYPPLAGDKGAPQVGNNDPHPTLRDSKDPPTAGNKDQSFTGNTDPSLTGSKDPSLTGNKDPAPDRNRTAIRSDTTQKNTNFNWTPGRIGGAWNSVPRNRNTGYNIFGCTSEGSASRTGNSASRTGDEASASSERALGGVDKAPFLNMRGAGRGGIRPSPWRTGTWSTYPFPGSTYNCFQGPHGSSKGYGIAGGMGYSRHGALGRGNSNLIKNNEIHLDKDQQVSKYTHYSSSQAQLKDGWKNFIL